MSNARITTSHCYVYFHLNVTAHFRRDVFEVKSDGVGFLDVSYSSMGVTVVTYVLISTGVVLDGDSLLASIQVNNPEINLI